MIGLRKVKRLSQKTKSVEPRWTARLKR